MAKISLAAYRSDGQSRLAVIPFIPLRSFPIPGVFVRPGSRIQYTGNRRKKQEGGGKRRLAMRDGAWYNVVDSG